MFNWMKPFILMAGITALFGVVGAAMGGQSGMPLALAFTLATNFFACRFSDKMALRMCNARQVDQTSAPESVALVRELAGRVQLPIPKVYLIDEAAPNAFATGRNPAHAALAAGGISGLFSTHPQTVERIERPMRLARVCPAGLEWVLPEPCRRPCASPPTP